MQSIDQTSNLFISLITYRTSWHWWHT